MALNLNSSDIYFQVGTILANWSSTGSAFFWLKLAASGNAAYSCPFNLSSDTARSSENAILENNNDGNWHMSVAQNVDAAALAAQSVGTWVCFGLAVGTGRKVFYGNGSGMADVTTATRQPSYYNQSYITLGQTSDGNQTDTQFNGLIAHVRLFSAELSEADFEAEAASATPVHASCVHSWALVSDLTDSVGGKTLVKGANGTTTYDSDTPYGASGVVVSSVSDTTLDDGQVSVTITGTGFSASGNTVIISPTDDVDDVDAETQTITAEGATSITFTAVRGALAASTSLYLFVIDNASNSNAAGSVVQFNTLKKLKLLVNSAAVGATVDGVVFAAQGGAIVGAEIGEFTGKTIVAGSGADAGKGVLLIPVTDFGGTALNEGDAPLVYLRNSTHFTPIWPGLIVPT